MKLSKDFWRLLFKKEIFQFLLQFQYLRVSVSFLIVFPYQKKNSFFHPYKRTFLINAVIDWHWILTTEWSETHLSRRAGTPFFDHAACHLRPEGSSPCSTPLKMSGNIQKQNPVLVSPDYLIILVCTGGCFPSPLQLLFRYSYLGFMDRFSEGLRKQGCGPALETVIFLEISLSSVNLFSFIST